MPKLGKVVLQGASGIRYEFGVYTRSDIFKPIAAVYFLAKRIPQGPDHADYSWIYVGHAEDISKRPFEQKRKACIDRYEANSVCLYIEESVTKRVAIEADLREAYDPPCNGK
jgi:hypothetical protein